MAKRDTGGSAFPTTPVYDGDERATEYDGMSLRDHFAGQALQALGNKVIATHQHASLGDSGDLKARAHLAYQMADAMLAERQR